MDPSPIVIDPWTSWDRVKVGTHLQWGKQCHSLHDNVLHVFWISTKVCEDGYANQCHCSALPFWDQARRCDQQPHRAQYGYTVKVIWFILLCSTSARWCTRVDVWINVLIHHCFVVLAYCHSCDPRWITCLGSSTSQLNSIMHPLVCTICPMSPLQTPVALSSNWVLLYQFRAILDEL